MLRECACSACMPPSCHAAHPVGVLKRPAVESKNCCRSRPGCAPSYSCACRIISCARESTQPRNPGCSRQGGRSAQSRRKSRLGARLSQYAHAAWLMRMHTRWPSWAPFFYVMCCCCGRTHQLVKVLDQVGLGGGLRLVLVPERLHLSRCSRGRGRSGGGHERRTVRSGPRAAC